MLAALHSWRAEINSTPDFDQRMRNLEIGGAEEPEAAARAIAGEVAGDDSLRPLDCHSCGLPFPAAAAKKPSNTRPYARHGDTQEGPAVRPWRRGKARRITFKLKRLSLKYIGDGAMLALGSSRRRHRMKIACLGGGPAGLYFAISMKLRDAAPRHHRVRAQPADDTFGWGVVFSDETFDNIAANDPPAPRQSAPTSPIGTTSRFIIAASGSSRAATAFPASPARNC